MFVASAVLALAGCVGGVENVRPAAQQNVVDMTRTVSSEEVGLQPAETVWVPGQYRPDGEAALYIKGRRFIVEGGYGNVQGFLKNDEGYLVAVRQPHVDLTDSRRGVFTVFYQVDGEGQVLRNVGVIQSGGVVLTGPTGIFVEVSQRSNYRVPLNSYPGYSRDGNLVSGPENVRVARPSGDGGWYVITPFKEDAFTGTSLERQKRYADGRIEVKNKELLMDTRELNTFPVSSAIFIDREPLTDSALAGAFLWLHREHNIYSRDGAAYRVRAVVGDKADGVIYYNVSNLGTRLNMSSDGALGRANRITVTEGANGPLIGTQRSGRGFAASQGWYLMDLSNMDFLRNSPEIFSLMGAGLNTLRTFVGQNTAQVSGDSRNDVYAVITPKTNVYILANRLAVESQGHKTYAQDIGSVNTQEIQGFIRTYGLN